MRLAFYNPAAGSGGFGSRVRRARAYLERLPDVELVPTIRGEIPAQTRRLLTADVTAVLACGGDGTVSDVTDAGSARQWRSGGSSSDRCRAG